MPSKSLRRGILSDLPLEENLEYVVENIVDFDPRIGKYLVKRTDYEDPTWEPLSHLQHCWHLVNKLRRKLKLKSVRNWDKQLCGAINTMSSQLNPKNWVPIKELAKIATRQITTRFQRVDLAIQIGYPRAIPDRTTIFVVSEFNHAIGILYLHPKGTTYVSDSMNIGETLNPIQNAVRGKLDGHRLIFVRYEYHAKNDFCASNLIAALMESIRWYKYGSFSRKYGRLPLYARELRKKEDEFKRRRLQAPSDGSPQKS